MLELLYRSQRYWIASTRFSDSVSGFGTERAPDRPRLTVDPFLAPSSTCQMASSDPSWPNLLNAWFPRNRPVECLLWESHDRLLTATSNPVPHTVSVRLLMHSRVYVGAPLLRFPVRNTRITANAEPKFDD